MDLLLEKIEEFLLPQCLWNDANKYAITPNDNLDELSYEIAVADHIRSMKVMFRDQNYLDESFVRELFNDGISLNSTQFSNISQPGISSSLTTEYLMNKNLEGRARAKALTKLCYGEETLPYQRSNYEVINAYATLGNWSNVYEEIGSSLTRYMHLQSKQGYIDSLQQIDDKGRKLAERIKCCFSCLRDHVIEHRGQVIASYCKELSKKFKELNKIQSEKTYDSFLDDAIGDDDDTDDDDDKSEEYQLIKAIRDYLDTFNSSTFHHNSLNFHNTLNKISSNDSPSWGNVIDHLRYQNPIMKQWLQDLNHIILPSIKSLLKLAFNQVDLQRRGIANPKNLLTTILSLPSTSKIFTNSNNDVFILLDKLKSDINFILYQNSPIDHVKDNPSNGIDNSTIRSSHNDSQTKFQSLNDTSRLSLMHITIIDINVSQDEISNMNQSLSMVSYELPITWEEYLCQYYLSNQEYSSLMKYNRLLKGQILMLLGSCYIHYNKNLINAEETIQCALNEYDFLGLHDSIISCELYQAIAQLMIYKYKDIQSNIIKQCEDKAEQWIQTDEGTNKLKSMINHNKANQVLININKSNSHDIDAQQYNHRFNKELIYQSSNNPTTLFSGQFLYPRKESYNTSLILIKNALLKEKIKEYYHLETNHIMKSLEASSRYLMKCLDIYEQYYHQYHIMIVSNYISIGLIKYYMKEYLISRDYYMKAMQILIKLENSYELNHHHYVYDMIHSDQNHSTTHSQNKINHGYHSNKSNNNHGTTSLNMETSNLDEIGPTTAFHRINQVQNIQDTSSPKINHDQSIPNATISANNQNNKDSVIDSSHLQYTSKNYSKLNKNQFNHPYSNLIAFIQIQLSYIMFRLHYDEEGIILLSNASIYHINRSFDDLYSINRTTSMSKYIMKPIKNKHIYQNIQYTISITIKLIDILQKNPLKVWDIVERYESLVQLTEIAYGYDSIDVAHLRKQLGIRYAVVGDWMNSIANFRKSLDILEGSVEPIEPTWIANTKQFLQDAAEKNIERFHSYIHEKIKSINLSSKIHPDHQFLNT